MARVRTDYPHAVREIEHLWIPLSDGARLAARQWLPVGADVHPVPAILEYLPYRKNDDTAFRDALHHPYFAGHGYACVRVDLRGSGESDGILYDEYLKREQDDALEVLAWLGAQPWCTGKVGMIGLSWGGFSGLQVAARRPPQLKTVIALGFTDDRYHDDVHYKGGVLLAHDMNVWASNMLGFLASPPDPRHYGDAWRWVWLERMEKTPPFIETWTAHQRRDAYWRHGSVCEDYGAITCPVYLVTGWADSYSNSALRLLAGLRAPRKALIGPWGHGYPYVAKPGPQIGFLQACLRWWDEHLKGVDTGVMAEPMLRVWLQDSVLPARSYAHRPGRWVAEPGWPSEKVTATRFYLNANQGLSTVHRGTGTFQIPTTLAHGLDSGVWCPYGAPGDFPGDQRREDALALSFTSEPIHEPVAVLGYPVVTLELAADKPLAQVVVRLCDVAPTGASTLLSYGVLNLTHRKGHEHPDEVVPGRCFTASLKLNALGHTLAAGHRWRVAVAPSYWPIVWPSPEPVTLSLSCEGSSHLDLPTRAPRAEDDDLAPFGPAEHAPPLRATPVRMGGRGRTVTFDQVESRYVLTDTVDSGCRRIEASGLEYEWVNANSYELVEGDPLSARQRSTNTVVYRRGAWHVRIETASTLSATHQAFIMSNVLEAYEGDMRVFARSWHKTILRDFT